MNVRNATQDDLFEIAKLHIKCFPDSFSTQLGEKLLARFYLEYLKKVPELFLVAESNKEIIGVCMGYYCEDNVYQKKFFRHNFFRLGIRCFKLVVEKNELMLKKIGLHKSNKDDESIQPQNNVESENKAQEKNKCGDLLSIFVKEDFRGQGVSINLTKHFHEVLINNRRVACYLSVKSNNIRAISFYEKMGYRIVKGGQTIRMKIDF